jgi:hypothetical protein
MLAGPMLLRAALLALAIGLSPLSAAPARATDAIPAEPGAVVLPDASILQAVAADLDGDGSRELVRLVRAETGAALAEVFALGLEGWAVVGRPVEVLAQGPEQPDIPLRLLVHRAGGAERVVIASQPSVVMDDGPRCCLLLHELVLEAGELRREQVAEPSGSVDAILAIDLDGDGTDELLTARSLPVLGEISFPTEARVYRWTDEAFAPPTTTELPVGSGDNPFILGDSDGRPGDEAAIISTLGAPGLYRIVLGEDDTLSVDEFGATVTDAHAVPVRGSRGIAVLGTGDGLAVHRWPAFGLPSPAHGRFTLPGIELIGAVEVGDQSLLLAHTPATSNIFVLLELPELASPPDGWMTASPAAGMVSGLPMASDLGIAPYVGPVPGGGPGGAAALMFEGRFLPFPGIDVPLRRIDQVASATLTGAEPVGLVGGGGWLAILHSPESRLRISPTGGRFDAPQPPGLSWLSIAPLETVLTQEADYGLLEPDVRDAVRTGAGGRLATGSLGFVADVMAPPGSRVLVLGREGDPRLIDAPREVPPSGRLSVPVVPPAVLAADSSYSAVLIVMTPAGHAYAAGWIVQVLTEPPALDVGVSTELGSSEVLVRGATATYASVLIDGRSASVTDAGEFSARVSLPPWPTDVEIVATDFVGNTARTVVSGVGIYDYRDLPWIPIVAMLLAAAGVGLYLRVPRQSTDRRPPDGDGRLEELEPD